MVDVPVDEIETEPVQPAVVKVASVDVARLPEASAETTP
jgi:hypothetical protein